MTVTLNLKPETEARIAAKAKAKGLPLPDYLENVIEEIAAPPTLTDKQKEDIALLQSWIDEDATDDPAELEAREREWEEFARNINENHSSDRIIFP